jgi:pimeloyl-ACP methyl ester carboxylesterase
VTKPTAVLVHGAFADASSWSSVVDELVGAGFPVIAAANPLRGLAIDAVAVADVVRSVDGPVVLVAHSYGGAVISNIPSGAGEIAGLVYVDAFAPDHGENCLELAARFPGSLLGEPTTHQVERSDGTTDLYLNQDVFHELFCADVPAARARQMAVTQRPATVEALTEPSGAQPLWREVPSWFLIGERDLIVPPELQRFRCERAGAERSVAIPGASHASCVSQPHAIANLIFEAAAVRGAVSV